MVRALAFLVARPLGPPTPVRLQRWWLEAMSTGGLLPTGTTVERITVGGRPAERVVPAGADEGRAVLFLHGGAFLIGSPRTHRVLAAHLAAAAGVPVVALHYRRAPEHPWPAAVDDAVAAYRELAAGGTTAVFGDSAGGCLALLLAVRLRDAGEPLPPALALVSPVTDLTLERSEAFRGVDTVVRRSWLRNGVRSFVGAADAHELSPLSAKLAGLPPVLLQVAGRERLRMEGEHLAERLRAEGVEVELEVLPRLWHDTHLVAHLVPEGADAVRRIGSWLRDRPARDLSTERGRTGT
jgi:monoterpene epsilon-lactone hydrolase